MAAYVVDTFDYVDNGVVQRKQTWQDPVTGATWDTFDPVGPADDPTLPNGTVVNHANGAQYAGNQAAVDSYNQSQIPPSMQPGANPVGLQGTTYNDGQRTRGTNNPQSGTYAAPAPTNQAESGGEMGPPPNAWNQTGGAMQAAAQGAPLGSPEDIERARNRFLYNPDAAQQSFDNVLRSRGVLLGLNNPLTNMLRQMAPGLAASFNIDNVMRNRGNEPSADIGGEFQRYIGGALNGEGGGLWNTLAGARNNIGAAIQKIGESEVSRIGNPALTEANPWIANLQQMLEANGGGNLAGVLRSLSAPFMTGTMSNAYGNALNQNLGQGIYNYGQPGGGFDNITDPNKYWLRQLMGGG